FSKCDSPGPSPLTIPTRRLHSPPIRASSRAFPAGGDGIAPGYACISVVEMRPTAGCPGGSEAETSHRGSFMPLYETVLIARNDVTQQQVEAIADGIGTELEADGGAVKKREYWGLRGLAYRIKKNRKGHYMLLGLDAKPAFVTEMERKLGLNEDVLRFMTVRIEEIDEA